jgi:HK97 family phage major capsid protein
VANLAEVIKDRMRSLQGREDELIGAVEKAGGTFSDEQRSELADIQGTLGTLATDLTAEEARQRRARIEPAVEGDVPGALTPLMPFAPDYDSRSLGERFAQDPEFRAFIEKVAPSGEFSKNRRIDSPAVSFKNLLRPRAIAPLSGGSATQGGAFILPGQSGIFDDSGLRRELSIRDVITTGTTDSDSVEYVRVTSETSNAAIVPEADSIDPTDTTGLKPQSDLAFERVNAPVQTIAHWVAATKRALADAGQLRTLVDNFLRYGLEFELEEQILNGDGNGDNFEGILVNGDVQTQAFVTNDLTTARKARTKVRTIGHAAANAYLLNPYDWEAIDLAMTMAGSGSNFRQAGSMTPPTLWGLPVIESEGMPEGTGLVGDFRQIVLWDREQASITASDGVNNFFLKNLVAVLAEMRAAMGIIRPTAFVAFETSNAS